MTVPAEKVLAGGGEVNLTPFAGYTQTGRASACLEGRPCKAGQA